MSINSFRPGAPGMPPFDASQLDPKVLMELSQMIQRLPPDQLGRMQTMMHNMMAGFDVRSEMEQFEKTLPPGFREKLFSIMGAPGAPIETAAAPASSSSAPMTTAPGAPAVPTGDMDVREARVTVLRAVAEGRLAPDDAERLLFPA